MLEKWRFVSALFKSYRREKVSQKVKVCLPKITVVKHYQRSPITQKSQSWLTPNRPCFPQSDLVSISDVVQNSRENIGVQQSPEADGCGN